MRFGRRLQLLLDEDRYARVSRAARAQRVSVATVIRDAIDVSLPPAGRGRAAAGAAVLAAEPMAAPRVEDLLRDLDRIRERSA